ncbi:hypothetical protein [Bifidobacterium aquikefiricola]|uniref:Uncharacterized protein n=1 Tax=Bifidobacterium aquikefiricola TaxID=3059038 RepID=A0AB39U6H6_9BIFI
MKKHKISKRLPVVICVCAVMVMCLGVGGEVLSYKRLKGAKPACL